MLYITLRRTGNNADDFAKLAQIHRMLKAQVGRDQFVVVLEGNGQHRIELSFPNESTCDTPSLRERVVRLVGPDNLQIRIPTM